MQRVKIEPLLRYLYRKQTCQQRVTTLAEGTNHSRLIQAGTNNLIFCALLEMIQSRKNYCQLTAIHNAK